MRDLSLPLPSDYDVKRLVDEVVSEVDIFLFYLCASLWVFMGLVALLRAEQSTVNTETARRI